MLGAAAGDAGTSARGASGREALTAPALPESRAGRRRSPRVWRLWHTLLTSAPLSCRSFAWRWSVLVSVLCVTCHREIKTTGRGAGTGPTELGRRRPHSLPRSRSSADRRLRGQTRRGSSVFAVRFGLSWELSFVTGDNTLSGLRRPPPASAGQKAPVRPGFRARRTQATRGVCPGRRSGELVGRGPSPWGSLLVSSALEKSQSRRICTVSPTAGPACRCLALVGEQRPRLYHTVPDTCDHDGLRFPGA